MTPQRRTPGTTRIEDRWTRRDGTPSARHGHGKRWLLRWIDHNGTEHTKTYTRKQDAKHHQNQLTTAHHTGHTLTPTRLTLNDAWTAWTQAQPHLAPTTTNDRRSNYNKHIKPHLGHRELTTIRRTDIQAFITDKATDGTKTPTLRTCLQNIRGPLQHAQDAGWITNNPATRIKLPPEQQATRPILTAPQVHLLTHHTDYLPELIPFLAYTGLRFGEAAALTPQDIDQHNRRIHITKAFTDVAGTMTLGSPKHHRHRTVPYPSILDDNLTQLIAYADPYIFTSIERRPLRHGNWRRRYFQPAVTAAQAEDTTFPTLTPHDLRHTAASLAIASGANVKAVQRMLGHSTATLTLDRYADLFPDDLDNVATSMDKLIRSGLRADQMTTGQTPNPEG